ncbi:MAG: hemolysin family protein [Oscillospiraceae bacterium]|nr:hemolysin family protein [Oscillospiraceae bacterium]
MSDPGPGNLTASILSLVLFVLLEVFIYLCRAALMALPETRAEELLKTEKKSVGRLIRHKDEVFLSMSFGSIFLTIMFAFVMWIAFGTRMTEAFLQDRMSAGGAEGLSAFLLCLAGAFVMMSLAGIVPRSLGRKRPVGVVTRLAAPALLIYYINIPIVKLASAFSSLFLRITGMDRIREEDNVTEAEILSMVDAGEETGTIENDQSEYIKNIFEFDDVYVSDLMTHRTDVTAVEVHQPIAELNRIAREEGYSRIPVYENDIDNVIGVAYIKDLLAFVGTHVPQRVKIADLMHEAFYVPESMRCDKLFKSMNEKHVQMAIAVDEYGGTAGIITMEDLIESIFGSIQDEYDEDEEEGVRKVGDTAFEMEGTTPVEDVAERLGISIPEDGDYDTIGGFLIAQLGFIPEDGTEATVKYGGYVWKVSDVDDQRIGQVRAERLQEPLEAENDDSSKKEDG